MKNHKQNDNLNKPTTASFYFHSAPTRNSTNTLQILKIEKGGEGITLQFSSDIVYNNFCFISFKVQNETLLDKLKETAEK